MSDKAYKVIVMKEEDWVEFRWQIALDVLGAIHAENLELVRNGVSILRGADAKATREWRNADGSIP